MSDEKRMTMEPRLSEPQLRMLRELAEPNGNPENEWYWTRSKLPTCVVLERHGLARRHETGTHDRIGYSITDDGRAFLRRGAQAHRGHSEGNRGDPEWLR